MRAKTRGRQTREPRHIGSDATDQIHHNALPVSGSFICNFPSITSSHAYCSIKCAARSVEHGILGLQRIPAYLWRTHLYRLL